jgi:ABC-2 type transport system permease protein
MHVKKSTIAKVQLSEVLTTGGLPILLFVPVFLATLSGLGVSGFRFWLALVLLIIFVVDILCITSVISFAVVFLSRGRFLKVLSSIMTMVTLFAFIFTLRFMDFSAIDLARPDRVAEQFGTLQGVITAPYLPWTPFVNSILGKTDDVVLFLLYSLAIIMILEFSKSFYIPELFKSLRLDQQVL